MKTISKTWIYPCLMTGLLIFFFSCGKDEETPPPDEVTDGDGNVYNTVTIGNQVWTVENLRTTKLNDGTQIPLVPENSDWNSLQTPGFCWYDNDETQFKNIYGALYNWHTIETGKLCPSGWHVPSVDEWEILHDFQGDSAASKLKETGNSHWSSQNKDATNSSGFTARPGGYRIPDTGYRDEGTYGYWWTSTLDPLNNTRAYAREMNAFSRDGSQLVYNKLHGLSVRCLKD